MYGVWCGVGYGGDGGVTVQWFCPRGRVMGDGRWVLGQLDQTTGKSQARLGQTERVRAVEFEERGVVSDGWKV